MKFKKIFFGLILFFSVQWIPYAPALKWEKISVERWDMKKGRVIEDVGPLAKNWIPLNKISNYLIYALISSEDSRFYSHFGLDIQEIYESFLLNIHKGGYVRGASTISQQVIKMSFLSQEKSITRKMREAVGTLWLESILSKERILEWYLNLVEFGDGIYGVGRASEKYFATKPQLLTIEQAIHLVLVLPSPRKWSVSLRKKKMTDFAKSRFSIILERMKMDGYINQELFDRALSRADFGNPIVEKTEPIPDEDLEIIN